MTTSPTASSASTATEQVPAAASHPPSHRRPPTFHRVGGPRRCWDWVLAGDPGLGHLQAGWSSLVSMTVYLAVGYGMSNALGVPAMLGMLVCGLMGMVSSFAVAGSTPLRLARAILCLAIPYAAMLPLASWLHPDRPLELCLNVFTVALGNFLIRFGPIGMLIGIAMFSGFSVGVTADIPLEDCGPLFVIAVVASVAVLAARLLLCYPRPRKDLLRTQRAFVVQARRVVNAAATALDPDAGQAIAIRRISRALHRLNVTTVTIDGHLARPEVAADPHLAELLHQYLFDAELALQGIGKAVQQIAGRPVPAKLREAMAVALVIARDTHLGQLDALGPAAELIRQQTTAMPDGATVNEDEVRALARRVADLLDVLADALAHWLNLGWSSPTTQAKVSFQPTVALERNRPAGTGPAARRVGAAQGGSGWRRAVPYWRLTLHAGAAAAIVCPIADAINPSRYFWALIGVMITFGGTNTTHERLRKLAHRMVGTVAGAVIGIALLHLIGPGHIYWTLAVIVAAIAFGAWGFQRRYAYWLTGLVAALVQTYGLTTPYRDMDWLLTQRLMDNALGILVATACAALIFPVPTRKVAREAQRGYLSALEHLVGQVAVRWKEPDAPVRLRGAARGVDAALLQVQSAVLPLVRMPLAIRGRSGENLLALLGTATQHAHELAAAADIDIDLAPHLRTRVDHITEVFASSLHALDRQIATGERDGTWIRVSPVIHELESVLSGPPGQRADRLHVALRELAALEEVLASIADTRGLTIIAAPPAAVPVADGATTSPVPAGVPSAPPAVSRDAASAPAGSTIGASAGNKAARPLASAAAAEEPFRGAAGNAGAVTLTGSLRCPEHPRGCEAWIVVVTSQGERRALAQVAGGRYQVTGLTPGTYTLIVISTAHAPNAQSLLVRPADGEIRRDIVLPSAS
ncbi:FUSC family protein [Actinacidiphila oryziradicis]|uniref:FUSC family protein n=1 Tax=Actinacidiphila oryziradicis TaxID=2571141 RepID=UPI00145CDF63|nr:FUSC family protein [Actinacidiphila oryziradicis]